MIIDSLTHVTPDGRWLNTNYDASEQRLLREMDDAGVDRAMVVALAGVIANDFVLDLCDRHRDRVLPVASFNPAAHATASDAAREFRSQLQGAPFRALKLHPRLNRYDPLDPRCLAVLEELATWKGPVPVWLDTLFYYQGARLRKPPVDAIHDLVGRFPKVSFVLLHGAGTQVLHLAEAVRDCRNVLIDLSFTLCRYHTSSLADDVRYLMTHFDRRTVFGSDFPEIGIKEALDRFYDTARHVPSEHCRNILGQNLKSLLLER